MIIFLPISFNMCFVCSKEPSHWDGSFEYPQHMFRLRKILFCYALLSGGLHSSTLFILLTCSIPIGNIYFQSEWRTVWIPIRWLLQKPADLDLQCSQNKKINPGSAGQRLSSEIRWKITFQIIIGLSWNLVLFLYYRCTTTSE